MKKLLILLLFTNVVVFAQTHLNGSIINAKTDLVLTGATIVEKHTNNGTISDSNGNFVLEISKTPTTIIISSLGYKEKEITIQNNAPLSIALTEGFQLDEVIVGSRSLLKSHTKTALPIRLINSNELLATREISLDKAIQYIEPSFNSVNVPVSDASSILDPFELRSLGSSRTLVLIDGKRKNSGALMYAFSTVGRGETGVDISAIPIEAIERIEILRDGASSQYGSDAIAGVVNIILKKENDAHKINLTTGVTSEGDGEFIDFGMHKGTSLGKNGFLNYTLKIAKHENSNRSGLVDEAGEYADFVYVDPTKPEDWPIDLTNPLEVNLHNQEGLEDVQEFLSNYPDAKNINGTPEKATVHFLFNGGLNLNANNHFYYNAAFNYKKLQSFANYRTPYWRTTDWGLLTPIGTTYQGYHPKFEGELKDYNATIGIKTDKNGWKTDASFTVGGNSQIYTVPNTVNRSETVFLDDGITPKYQENSPILFNAGGLKFTHYVTNFDVSKLLSPKLSFAAGTEFRIESFETIEGGLPSWEGGGSDSFSGYTPNDSFTSNRYNIGAYTQFSLNVTDDWLIDASARIEDYSDFGKEFIWKISSHLQLLDKTLALRTALSTGFRAPSLQQRNLQKLQYSFVAGEGVQKEMLINNTSSEAQQLGIPSLSPEESLNFTLGLEYNPTNQFDISLDYYIIEIHNRIVLGNRIEGTESTTTDLDAFLLANDIKGFNFFSNALDTRTSGIDLISNYKNILFLKGVLQFHLSANYSLENKAISPIKNPSIIENTGQTIFNEEMQALLFTARPEYKVLLGIDYNIDNFDIHLGNQVIGPALFRNNGMDTNIAVEFETKALTDLGLSYAINKKTNVFLEAKNIFNVLPEWKFKALNNDGTTLLSDPSAVNKQSNLITFNQRYSQNTYDGSHFNYLGTRFIMGLRYSF